MFAGIVLNGDRPQITLASGGNTFGSDPDVCTAITCIHRVKDDKTGVLHPTIGIDECLFHAGNQRRTGDMLLQADTFRTGKFFTAAKVIIQEQAQPDHPGRTQSFDMGQNETKRPDNVRSGVQKHFALDQGLTHKAEFVMFKITQPAMDQLCAGR
eukprot:GFYU01015550.1.p2 GENE.GFYU01015550.1~~GFYU01015550.1.p2  ORF type:complete len:155 (-),score=0.73 GFYU01015550.1:157-621(-)